MKIKPKPRFVLISHRHGDHMKYMKEWQKLGRICFSGEIEDSAFGVRIEANKIYKIGKFEVTTLAAIHDTENTLNFLLDDGVNRILYEVDNAKRLYPAERITHYIAECNWDEATMKSNNLERYRENRLRATHKSLEILLEELDEMDKSCLKEVWLAHCSDTNLNKELAKITIQEKVGVPVYFA